MQEKDSTAPEARDPRRSLVDFIEVYGGKMPAHARPITKALAKRAADPRPIVLMLPRRARCWPWPR